MINTSHKLVENLRAIQDYLKTVFNLLKIPYLEKIETINPLSGELIKEERKKIIALLDKILTTFHEIESEKLIQITDFKKFLREINPIIKNIISFVTNLQIDKYIHFYLLIQVYWFIEYFIKHDIEFKNNEYFNERHHYKWIIDDICLDFLFSLRNDPNSTMDNLTDLDKSRLKTLKDIKLITIENKKVNLTSLGLIMIDLTEIGDFYIYYIDEFNELFEESRSKGFKTS